MTKNKLSIKKLLEVVSTRFDFPEVCLAIQELAERVEALEEDIDILNMLNSKRHNDDGQKYLDALHDSLKLSDDQNEALIKYRDKNGITHTELFIRAKKETK